MRALPCALLLMPAVLLAAQGEKEKWQRVYTGEDSIIEINASKVTFVEYNVQKNVTFSAARIGRVGFRTILSKPESLKEKPGVKYKSRLETIEFNCVANRYRLYEATLLDEKARVVKTFGWDPSAEWREMKHGGMLEKVSGPACKLIDEKRRNP